MNLLANITRSVRTKQLGIVLICVGVLGLIIMGFGAWNSLQKEFNRPLGPTLVPIGNLPDIGNRVSADVTPGTTSQENTAEHDDLSPESPTQVPAGAKEEQPRPKPLCGGPETMVILAVGADEIGLADSIRVARIDFVTPSVSVLAFPRDLWVSIPGLEDWGITQGKINTAYIYGNRYLKPYGGPIILAHTLYQNFGLAVDHYVAVDMSLFQYAIDRLGGVDLYLTGNVNGTSVGLPYSPSGWYHLTGEQTLEFARIRDPDSDWHRIDRQSQVLMAVRERILLPENLLSIPGIAVSFLDDVKTNLSKADISRLLCLLPKIDEGEISSYKIERELVTPTINKRGAYVMIPHEEEIRKFVVDFMRGDLGRD